jgi:hypothetical protein
MEELDTQFLIVERGNSAGQTIQFVQYINSNEGAIKLRREGGKERGSEERREGKGERRGKEREEEEREKERPEEKLMP